MITINKDQSLVFVYMKHSVAFEAHSHVSCKLVLSLALQLADPKSQATMQCLLYTIGESLFPYLWTEKLTYSCKSIKNQDYR